MKRNIINKTIEAWFLISLIICGSAVEAAPEWIIVLAVNFIAATLCLDKIVIGRGKKRV